MKNETTPTPGPWVNQGTGIHHLMFDAPLSSANLIASVPNKNPDSMANAKLIAEAGTVYHETGLTPREILAQRDELIQAIRKFFHGGWDEPDADAVSDLMAAIEDGEWTRARLEGEAPA